MSESGEEYAPQAAISDPVVEPTARFGQVGPGNHTLIQNVHLRTDEVNINQSSLAALERIASHSPQIADKLLESTNFVVKQDTKRFLGGSIVSGVVACTLLVCSTLTVIHAGFWAGIALFMCSVVVSAVMVAALTGKVTDISWVIRVLPGRKVEAPKESED